MMMITTVKIRTRGRKMIKRRFALTVGILDAFRLSMGIRSKMPLSLAISGQKYLFQIPPSLTGCTDTLRIVTLQGAYSHPIEERILGGISSLIVLNLSSRMSSLKLKVDTTLASGM
jgi:hypothetical protein